MKSIKKLVVGVLVFGFFAACQAENQTRAKDETTHSTSSSHSTKKTKKPKVAILVPSMGSWHMERHDEAHKYFQGMHKSFENVDGTRLEVFKDWLKPAVIKDFVHYRLDKACNSGVIKDQVLIDRTRKAKMLLHAAVPDQVQSGLEAGWRADHRILAAQALAFKVIDYQRDGYDVTLIGLGIGGGQIAAGATRLLGDTVSQMKSLNGVAEGLASALDATAPFFGQYAIFVTWGAKAVHFAARASDILKNDTYLWQASQMPVTLHKQAAFKGKVPSVLVNKLFTVGVPVGKSSFEPDTDVVDKFYNLYSKGDLRCRFMGGKTGLKESRHSGVVNLAIKFDHRLVAPGHIKMLNSSVLAGWIPYIHEHIKNPQDFKFGAPGKLIISKSIPPVYSEEKKSK